MTSPTLSEKVKEILVNALLHAGEELAPPKSTPMGGEYHDGYSAGWNACREEMLRRLK